MQRERSQQRHRAGGGRHLALEAHLQPIGKPAAGGPPGPVQGHGSVLDTQTRPGSTPKEELPSPGSRIRDAGVPEPSGVGSPTGPKPVACGSFHGVCLLVPLATYRVARSRATCLGSSLMNMHICIASNCLCFLFVLPFRLSPFAFRVLPFAFAFCSKKRRQGIARGPGSVQ